MTTKQRFIITVSAIVAIAGSVTGPKTAMAEARTQIIPCSGTGSIFCIDDLSNCPGDGAALCAALCGSVWRSECVVDERCLWLAAVECWS